MVFTISEKLVQFVLLMHHMFTYPFLEHPNKMHFTSIWLVNSLTMIYGLAFPTRKMKAPGWLMTMDSQSRGLTGTEMNQIITVPGNIGLKWSSTEVQEHRDGMIISSLQMFQSDSTISTRIRSFVLSSSLKTAQKLKQKALDPLSI